MISLLSWRINQILQNNKLLYANHNINPLKFNKFFEFQNKHKKRKR